MFARFFNDGAVAPGLEDVFARWERKFSEQDGRDFLARCETRLAAITDADAARFLQKRVDPSI